MATPSSARWRPPNSRRSITYWRWSSWIRLALAAVLAAMTIAGLVRGTNNVVGSVLFLFVAAFLGSAAIWQLQGIHAIAHERREEPPTDPQP